MAPRSSRAHREGGRGRTGLGLDRPLHLDQWAQRKPEGAEPLMRARRVGDTEGREVARPHKRSIARSSSWPSGVSAILNRTPHSRASAWR